MTRYMQNKPSICVIGLGYIGLPTALLFANNGFNVSGCDINQNIVNLINSKKPPFNEEELLERLENAIDSGKLRAYTYPMASDVYIITVQTPYKEEICNAELGFLNNAVESIKPILKDGDLVIVESTIPPGTTLGPVCDALASIRNEKKIFIAHVPEHALVGKLFFELINNSRLIGGVDPESTDRAADLYSKVVKGKLIKTDATTAELVKIMENTYRDVNIALANELAKYAESIGVNIWEAIDAANKHPRVNIHRPGPGVGGECIAVDPLFLLNNDKVDMPLVRAARSVNDSMPQFVVNKIEKILSKSGQKQPMIALLGLSFKANVSDSRNSPSKDICHILDQKGIRYKAYDPHAAKGTVNNQVDNLMDALKGADLAVVLVDHDDFLRMCPKTIKGFMRTPVIFDTKNCLDHSEYRHAGFKTCLLGYKCN
ncbi:MAG: nucleotide sugar dehydrogenase [Methanomassiliicoccales archaeon]|nr:MAG: nucleotide sugar dehydrogenase [Methanomassiliicoccales archaeon]